LKKELAYIDSNIFVYPVLYSQETDLRVKKAANILRDIANGELLAFTSTLTWDEVIWTIRKFLGKSESINQGQKLLGFTNLHFINVDENILSRAQILMSNYNLKPRDSIHAASAIDKKLKTIISDDIDFDKVKEITRIPLV
jgi:predicted nucleic acid-binding protein